MQIYEMGIDTMLMCFCEACDNKSIDGCNLPAKLTEFRDRADAWNEEMEAKKKAVEASQLGKSQDKEGAPVEGTHEKL